ERDGGEGSASLATARSVRLESETPPVICFQSQLRIFTMPITSNPGSSAGHGGTTAATIAKNGSTATTVKDKLLSVLDDIELISKELFELLLLPKHARAATSATHQSSLSS